MTVVLEGTKPRRLSDVHFIDVARSVAVPEILHLSGGQELDVLLLANVILVKSSEWC